MGEFVVGIDIFNSNLTYDNTSYFTDGVINFNDNHVNRSFETLITERSQSDENSVAYSEFFKEIRNKLHTIYDPPVVSDLITDEQIEIFNKRYPSSSTLKSNINSIKKSIVEFYDKKSKLEHDIEESQKKYQMFSESILTSIVYMYNITNNTTETPEDIQLKDILMDRIQWYYSQLKIDSLKKEYADVLQEYSYLKGIITDISSVMPCGICQICLDEQVCFFIDPCGHTICENCKNRSKNNPNCSFCRTKVSKYLKMYL
jgi:hypothetical protein